MLGLAALPALLQAVLLAVLPESPRWLMAHGKAAAAQHVLRGLRGDAYVGDELREQHDDQRTVRFVVDRTSCTPSLCVPCAVHDMVTAQTSSWCAHLLNHAG